MDPAKKKVLILATGGTIACVSTAQGFVPGVTAEELTQYVPELPEIAQVTTKQLMNIDSSDMRPHDWKTIARTIASQMKGVDGIVITHGTDTMCYTAAALSFSLPNLKIPVILTGAQQPMTVSGSDAASNLLEACIGATMAPPGVYVAFNHKLIHGPRAFKMYAKNVDAYVSRNFPDLGHFTPDHKLVMDHKAKTYETADKSQTLNTKLVDDVFLLKMTPCTNADVLDFVYQQGYQGLVIEGFGTGGISNLNRGMYATMRELIHTHEIPVLMISQCPYDGVNLAVYGIGEQALELGVIPGQDMTTEAALVKMMWALGQAPHQMDELSRLLGENICDEMTEGNS